jgi:hypothetical protein
MRSQKGKAQSKPAGEVEAHRCCSQSMVEMVCLAVEDTARRREAETIANRAGRAASNLVFRRPGERVHRSPGSHFWAGIQQPLSWHRECSGYSHRESQTESPAKAGDRVSLGLDKTRLLMLIGVGPHYSTLPGAVFFSLKPTQRDFATPESVAQSRVRATRCRSQPTFETDF